MKLNHLFQGNLNENTLLFREDQNILINLNLDLSREYDDNILLEGTAQLLGETKKHGGTLIKIVTKLVQEREILEILSNTQISSQNLNVLNERYELGLNATDGQLDHGSIMCAYYFAKLGGKVTMELIEDNEYKVRNCVIFY